MYACIYVKTHACMHSNIIFIFALTEFALVLYFYICYIFYFLYFYISKFRFDLICSNCYDFLITSGKPDVL